MNLPAPNAYWGRKYGMCHPSEGNMFKIKKWGNGRWNSGPQGSRYTRFYLSRNIKPRK